MLEPLRVSPEFRGIRARLVHEAPVDTWREDGFHFFVFELAAAAEPEGATGEPPVAVFAVHADTAAVISAVTVEPRAGDGRTEITDLRSAGGAYTA